MAKKPRKTGKAKSGWSQRVELTREEVLKRMEDFPKRRDKFIAAIRKGKNRDLSA